MQTLVNYDELPESVRNFVSYKLTVQGRSKKTMDEYALDLRTFFRWLTAKRRGEDVRTMDDDAFAAVDITGVTLDTINSVTPEEIFEFMNYTIDRRGNKWSARARKLSALKSV